MVPINLPLSPSGTIQIPAGAAGWLFQPYGSATSWVITSPKGYTSTICGSSNDVLTAILRKVSGGQG